MSEIRAISQSVVSMLFKIVLCSLSLIKERALSGSFPAPTNDFMWFLERKCFAKTPLVRKPS